MKTRLEQIINLLTDEIEQRLRQRGLPATAPGARAGEAAPAEQRARPPASSPNHEPRAVPERATAEKEPPSRPLGAPHAARLIVRLALVLVVLIVLVNIPLNRFGTTLATMLPDSSAWVMVDGFVVKEEDDPEIYVFQDGRLRWISSIQAFEAYGWDWGDVHVAEDGYLDGLEIGPPLEVVAKCWNSPHVYLLERGEKRWIRDIETFTSEGYVWEDVRTLDCSYLRSIPDGETIPPGSGPPPRP
jgi:hypothetical protein